MHTISQLVSGELKGTKRIKLALGLKEFPVEIFDYSDSLEILDMTGNKLSSLPPNFGCLKRLKIAFFSDNEFVEFPEVLSECPSLEMIGFKSNQISTIAEGSLPRQTRWLILTNNKLKELPASIGECLRLQKCMLAGNHLQGLPDEMSKCTNLELLRISANSFQSFPDWLFSLPKLSWLALAGNPCMKYDHLPENLKEIDWSSLELVETLGEGASGIISKAKWRHTTESVSVAVKVFKGEVTSDGLPGDEMRACMAAGIHANLVTVLGKITNHPDNKQGLVFRLIPSNYRNLGGPPNFDTCTRDVFSEEIAFSPLQILHISKGIASASAHLHEYGISHGDLYSHNILVDDQDEPLFGDFGAATIYDKENTAISNALEKIEVRAFGCLLDDLLMNLKNEENQLPLVKEIWELKDICLQTYVDKRPSFKDLKRVLDDMG